MAIYHLHAQVIQRSKGKNIIAASAYRRAARLHDNREARDWDFTAKKDVIYSELMVPENAPPWVQSLVELHQMDPSKAAEVLWNSLDAAEKRIDAQLGREIEFALPIELNEMQSIQLAREFIQDQFVLRGMIADWSVHWDKGNPHVHVLLTMRSLTETGFGLRVREWDKKDLLFTWREKWAEYANFHLHCHQHAVRIDHRSYEEQGVDLKPGIHQGKAAQEKARRGEVVDRVEEIHHIRRLNLARLSENAEIVFHSFDDTFTDTHVANVLARYVDATSGALSRHHTISHTKKDFEIASDTIQRVLQTISMHESVFQEKDIVKALSSVTEQAETLAKVIQAIKKSPQVIALGVGENGHARFTTRRLFETENRIQTLADKLQKRWHLRIPDQKKAAVLAKYQEKIGKSLTNEQKIAINHLLKPRAITCMVGRAGTGKSFCLGAAKSLWESQGLSVHGIALSGIAADGLSKDAGLPSTTIASFCFRVENQLLTLNQNDVVVMDEAGMTDSRSMLAVLKLIHKAKAKLVLVGDPAQLQPVGPGASFRALVERLGFVELQHIYRQEIPWQRKATIAFSKGSIAKGLAAYKIKNSIHIENAPETAMQQLVKNWWAICRDKSSLDNVLVIAHRNDDIQQLNSLLRACRVEKNYIDAGYSVNTTQGKIKIASNDRVLFLKNDRELGISNGRFATIESIDFDKSHKVISFTAKLDGSDKKLTINPIIYPHFTYGYAATVHKTQGMTVDHSLVYAGGKGWNRHLTYVAFSRHRQSCHLYADRQTHPTDRIFTYRLSRLGLKDSVLDFPLAFVERRGIDPESIRQKIIKHLANQLEKWKKQITDKIEQWVSLDKTLHQVEQSIELEKNSIKTLLLRYVDMELKQTRLVNAMHSARLQDPNAAKQLSEQAIIHSKRIQDFAEKIIDHSEIKNYLAVNKDIKLTDHDGFIKICERFQKGKWLDEDIYLLIKKLQNKAMSQSHIQTQNRSQDGRKR